METPSEPAESAEPGPPAEPAPPAPTPDEAATRPLDAAGPPPAPPEAPPRRRRWWIWALVALAVLLLILIIARNRREEAAEGPSSPTTVSAPSGGPAGEPGTDTAPEGEAPDDGQPSDGEVPDGEVPDGDADGVTPLAAPTITSLDATCEQFVPVGDLPCSVTLRWSDEATDETGYRVEVDSQQAGSILAEYPPDATLYNRLFELGDTICVRVTVVRGEETAASDQQCVTTSL